MQSHLLLKQESYNIIGAAMTVHSELGCGFLEAVYQEALEEELKTKRIPYEREKQLDIVYKQKRLKKSYQADFLCNNNLIIELKAVNCLDNIHQAQLINYLKITNIRLGILINFGRKSLEYKRVINTKHIKESKA